MKTKHTLPLKKSQTDTTLKDTHIIIISKKRKENIEIILTFFLIWFSGEISLKNNKNA